VGVVLAAEAVVEEAASAGLVVEGLVAAGLGEAGRKTAFSFWLLASSF
jgi:hypothetical protein